MYACSPREWNGPWDRIGRLPRDAPNERYPNKISSPSSPRRRRRSLYSNDIRRHRSRAFSLTFIIQGTVLCSPENAVASCGAVHDAILIRAKMSLLVSPEFIILIMAPHELPRPRPRVSPRTWQDIPLVASQTVCRCSDQQGKAAGYIHSKIKYSCMHVHNFKR